MSTVPLGQYEKQPTVPLPADARVLTGASAWAAAADAAAAKAGERAPLIVVDAYPGADLPLLAKAIAGALPDWRIVDVEDAAALPIAHIDARFADNLTEDRVFGVLSHATVDAFYDAERLDKLAVEVDGATGPTVLLGWGADLVARRLAHPYALVLADMARWELQLRQRAGATNWRAENPDEDQLRKYKRGFFVEWRVADRHKTTLFDRLDFVLDANAIGSAEPTGRTAGMITGEAFRAGLRDAARAPLRVVPFFDPGVWGGQWMKQRLDLDPGKPNYAWCFDCVPEENSLLLEDAEGAVVEIPSLDLVLAQPEALLGERTYARFGAEFPIRFDFLDTMEGGNLSLQVHPLTDYIQRTFGMHYTQDESYYMLDAGDDAVVYLGTKDGVDRDAMLADLRAAETGERPFPAERYVNAFPAKKHDHFLIPAGTIHSSGANSMVLEISATPFIFTFKLWDWGRLGLDGVPRPVHIDHGERNLVWKRDTAWTEANLVNRVETITSEGDVVEERTGLHELEFIEVRRHWFAEEVTHDTEGTVNVLNLVEGDEVEITSPTGAFAPYTIHYAETFIVPAAVGPYVIRRTARSRSERFGTVKASVRGTRTSEA
ncbi:class I mannose-6-phosphate isomerase [Glycomyces algeriensis]|uniref:Mannose-6-phosphate isomerase n=1 Tax=Glycomyces algeriensis TaxID=256037 RepID=A0A9W6GA80_9ACTN|nr:class I mannose-6-phosphate isomerase [Glycomyces algeriensis]MDA1364470.1 class I mannose-6-phosphate isomerase [Glycomyces algeriensis]MDR7350503.1 mannose-6-phosphate isomerase class I [Glycomyces algeriensis]GLI43211.1 mannose-6-phosphate isomerase [Glycomyces algeriensis]